MSDLKINFDKIDVGNKGDNKKSNKKDKDKGWILQQYFNFLLALALSNDTIFVVVDEELG